MFCCLQVGGLGDVVTSLSRAVQELNHNVDIIFPKYDCIKYNFVRLYIPFLILPFCVFASLFVLNFCENKIGEGLTVQ